MSAGNEEIQEQSQARRRYDLVRAGSFLQTARASYASRAICGAPAGHATTITSSSFAIRNA